MEPLDKLKELIRGSRVMSFLGGAGVSTESGIPDFRDPRVSREVESRFGYPPEIILGEDFFWTEPALFYAYYREYLLKEAQPNPAHLALAGLEARGKLNALITQNVDDLHRMAGSKRVYALHGSVEWNRCTACAAFYHGDYIRKSSGIPRCSRCGGIIKPEVVLYGEPLDPYILRNAQAALWSADLLIVGGTSLSVYPAAGLLEFFSGKHLVVINRSPTPADGAAELVIRAPIGAVLQAAAG